MVQAVTRAYPQALEHDIRLPGGEHLLVRPIRGEDEAALTRMVDDCSAEDRRLRFFGALKHLPAALATRLSRIDYAREMALIAVPFASTYGSGPIFGVARVIGDADGRTAEFAVLVRSDLKGHGLGYRLLTEVLSYARKEGLQHVYGDVLSDNAAMLQMTRELGFRAEYKHADPGVTRVTLDMTACG